MTAHDFEGLPNALRGWVNATARTRVRCVKIPRDKGETHLLRSWLPPNAHNHRNPSIRNHTSDSAFIYLASGSRPPSRSPYLAVFTRPDSKQHALAAGSRQVARP